MILFFNQKINKILYSTVHNTEKRNDETSIEQSLHKIVWLFCTFIIPRKVTENRIEQCRQFEKVVQKVANYKILFHILKHSHISEHRFGLWWSMHVAALPLVTFRRHQFWMFLCTYVCVLPQFIAPNSKLMALDKAETCKASSSRLWLECR